jgi:hypothetical protein
MKNSFDIPRNYSDNKVVLMVRDPRTLYAYWEINEEVRKNAEKKVRGKGLAGEKLILRVYNMTENNSERDPRAAFDLELKPKADSWYIHLSEPGGKWMVEVGVLCSGDSPSPSGEGRDGFLSFVRSNTVTAPVGEVSDMCDEKWDKGTSKSPLEIKKLVDQYLEEWLSSGNFGDMPEEEVEE